MAVRHLSELFNKRSVPSRLRNVLISLCDIADDHGFCHPTIDHIAWKSESSTRTVSRTLAELEEMDVVKVRKRYKRSSIYKLNLAALPKKDPWGGKSISEEYQEFEKELSDDNLSGEFSGDNLSKTDDNLSQDDDKRDTKSATDGEQNRHGTAMEPSGTLAASDSGESSSGAPNENRHDSKVDDGEKPLKPIDLVMSLWEANGLGEKHPEEEANKGKNFSLAKTMIGEGVAPEEIAAMTKTFQKNREHMDVPPPFPMTMVYLWGKGGAVYKSWVADGRPGLEGKDSYVPKDPEERAKRAEKAKEEYDRMARQQVEAMAGMANGEHR